MGKQNQPTGDDQSRKINNFLESKNSENYDSSPQVGYSSNLDAGNITSPVKQNLWEDRRKAHLSPLETTNKKYPNPITDEVVMEAVDKVLSGAFPMPKKITQSKSPYQKRHNQDLNVEVALRKKDTNTNVCHSPFKNKSNSRGVFGSSFNKSPERNRNTTKKLKAAGYESPTQASTAKKKS